MNPAELDWDEAGTPQSRRHGDIYYNRRDGLAESRHVFLAGCDLPGLLAAGRPLTVGEIGFGTGLNLLALWQLWRELGRPAPLTFLSCELYPLAGADLARAHARFPELSELAAELRRALPPPVPGLHARQLEDGLRLLLWHGDALAGLAAGTGGVDAWFLDGFAPQTAPDLWSPELMRAVAARSAPGARIASFSVARSVREALAAAGFETRRRPGIHGKREVLAGRSVQHAPPPAPLHPWVRLPAPAIRPQTALVIGAGLAGAWAARALAEAGMAVTVLEAGPEPAAGASGNRLALAVPRLLGGDNAEATFFHRCFLHAEAELHRLGHAPRGPVLSHLPDAAAIVRAEALVAAQPLGSGRLEIVDGAWLRQPGGVIAPPALVATLLDHPRIALLCNSPTAAPQRQGERWRVGTEAADIAVVAAAMDSTALLPQAALSQRAAAGRIALLPPQGAPEAVIRRGESWRTPALDGMSAIGASWEGTVLGDERAIRETVAATGYAGAVRLQGGVRATTVDHLPLAGPVADSAAVLAAHPHLRHGAVWPREVGVPFAPGLFVLSGLGARGAILAPLLARLIAAQALGDAWPLEPALAMLTAPLRQPWRDTVRGKKR